MSEASESDAGHASREQRFWLALSIVVVAYCFQEAIFAPVGSGRKLVFAAAFVAGWLAPVPRWTFRIGTIAAVAGVLSFWILSFTVSLAWAWVFAGCAVVLVVTSTVAKSNEVTTRWLPVTVASAGTAIAVAVLVYSEPPPTTISELAAAVERTPNGGGAVRIRLTVELRGCGERPETRLSIIELERGSVSPRNVAIVARVGKRRLKFEGSAGLGLPLPGLVTTSYNGIDRCFVQIPSLFGDVEPGHEPWAMLDARQRSEVTEAEVILSGGLGDVAIVRGQAATQAGNPTIIRCDPREGSGTGGLPKACSSVALLREPTRPTLETVLAVVVGALFSVVVEMVIRAVDRRPVSA